MWWDRDVKRAQPQPKGSGRGRRHAAKTKKGYIDWKGHIHKHRRKKGTGKWHKKGDGHTKFIQAETRGRNGHTHRLQTQEKKTHKHKTHLHAQIQPAEHRRRKRRRKGTREMCFAPRFALSSRTKVVQILVSRRWRPDLQYKYNTKNVQQHIQVFIRPSDENQIRLHPYNTKNAQQHIQVFIRPSDESQIRLHPVSKTKTQTNKLQKNND